MMYPTPEETKGGATQAPPGWAVRRLPDGTHVLRRTVLGRLGADGWPLVAMVLLVTALPAALFTTRSVGTAGERAGLLALFAAVAAVGVALRLWATRTEVVAGPRRIEVWRGWPRMRCVYDAEGDHTELRIGTRWGVVSDDGGPVERVERELAVAQIGNGYERIVGVTLHTTPERWLAEGAATGDEAALLGAYLSRVTGWPLKGLPPSGGG